ncbi:UNVERIFIED_ORG: transposase [Variovorax paradoxus]|nr:transposase [Variovorax paradoxus]
MQSQTSQTLRRRRHDAQFKAGVIAACREPGASVAAVAQAHGLNANLVRKWLVGRGVKRCGMVSAPGAGAPVALAAATRSETPPPAMPFVPVQLPAPAPAQSDGHADAQSIEIELTRDGATLTVRWPSAKASACTSWLGELVQVLSR